MIDLKEVKVIIKKTRQIGIISACNLPLKDDVNYCVRICNSPNFKQWRIGKELELI